MKILFIFLIACGAALGADLLLGKWKEDENKRQNLSKFLKARGKFLGRHFGCRPLDPTLDIWSNFVKKKEKALNVHFSFHLLCCISSNVARVPKGSPRFPKVL